MEIHTANKISEWKDKYLCASVSLDSLYKYCIIIFFNLNIPSDLGTYNPEGVQKLNEK